jgi:Phage portal protein, SPP1 Gp6-like
VAIVLDDEQWLKRLISRHDKELPELQLLNDHFEGNMPLKYLHPELLAELDNRLEQVVINWPELVVDCLDERLDVMGFRVSGQAKPDAGLEEIWQYNDLDEWSQQGHVEALVMRRSFEIVGVNDNPDEPPIITVESPLEVYAEFDPRTREVLAAVKRWEEEDGNSQKIKHATLYRPNKTSWWLFDGGKWVLDPDYEPDEHNLGIVPVTPVVNRPRLGRPGGKSELSAIIPVSNAANKIATDMMVSAEFHAMPRRWALGFGPEDFQDEQGNKVSAWSKVAGKIWATEKTRTDGAEVGQFAESQLSNFHATLNLLAQIVGSLGALTPQTMGLQNAANPATADAIRAGESRLVKRAERRQKSFGGAHERTMRIADRIWKGTERRELRRLETLWRDASTPTVAQTADASTKLFQSRIVPLRQTREDLQYSAEQITLMEAEDAKQAEQEQAAIFGPVKQDPTAPQDVPQQQVTPVSQMPANPPAA